MPTAKPAVKTFDALLEHSGNSLNWIIVRVPVDVAKVWGTRGRLKVQGEINGFAFRTSLFPTGKGSHFFIVNKQMQRHGKAAPGMKAKFRLQPDSEPREVKPPEELLRELHQSKRLLKFYESFNDSIRRWIAGWVAQGKHAETRTRRAQQIAERLFATMEAERELPPVLQVAFARNPEARRGWERMSLSMRRHHLMGIFGYQNPESRARRVAKAVEDMLRHAEKSSSVRRKGKE